jgi:hypothetical protein
MRKGKMYHGSKPDQISCLLRKKEWIKIEMGINK